MHIHYIAPRGAQRTHIRAVHFLRRDTWTPDLSSTWLRYSLFRFGKEAWHGASIDFFLRMSSTSIECHLRNHSCVPHPKTRYMLQGSGSFFQRLDDWIQKECWCSSDVFGTTAKKKMEHHESWNSSWAWIDAWILLPSPKLSQRTRDHCETPQMRHNVAVAKEAEVMIQWTG